MDSESLGGERLVDYDVIVAIESRHRDYVLSFVLSVEVGLWCGMLGTRTLWIEKPLGK